MLSLSGISRIGSSEAFLFSSSREENDDVDKPSPNFNCFFLLSFVGDNIDPGDLIGDFGGARLVLFLFRTGEPNGIDDDDDVAFAASSSSRRNAFDICITEKNREEEE